jgi:hypothetical protein
MHIHPVTFPPPTMRLLSPSILTNFRGRASASGGAIGTLSSSSRAFTSSSRLEMSSTPKGFDTIALHGGYTPDTETSYGMGYGAPRGVPLYRTTPFVFKNSDHAADLFALKELGNIYSRLMNPTNHVLESRYAQLEGAHEMAGLSVASGTNAIFYAVS